MSAKTLVMAPAGRHEEGAEGADACVGQLDLTAPARRMSTAAAVLALLSAVIVVAMSFSRGGAPAPQQPKATSNAEIVGLAAAYPPQGEPMTRETLRAATHRGWQRTYLPGVVRAGPAPDAPVLKELPAGSLVYSKGSEDGSLHVSRPVPGWISMKNKGGVVAVYPEMGLQGLGEDADIEQALHTDSHQEALNEKLRAQVMEATQVQVRLQETLRKAKEMSKALEQHPEQVVARTAGKAATEVVADKGVQNVFLGLAQRQDMHGLMGK